MPLKHADIWRAIDRLAAQNGLSPSGLARRAGLSPTVFNPSKRLSKKRARWPSTESIARVLQATDTDLDHFVGLATAQGAARTALPLLTLTQAGNKGMFDAAGHPANQGWEDMRFPATADPHAFALEITGKDMEPVYRAGDRIVISPAEKPRRGDRVALRTKKGEILIRQLARESAQKIELLTLGPGGAPLALPARDIEWMYRIVWASQ